LDLLNLGDERAFSLGVNTARLRILLLAAGSIPPLVALSFSGSIALVGIIVPQMIRCFKPQLFRPLTILSCLYGGVYAAFIDTLGGTLLAHVLIPTGVVVVSTALPTLIFLMQKGVLTDGQ